MNVKEILSAVDELTKIDGTEIYIFPLTYINDFTYEDFGIDFSILQMIPVLDLHDACYGCYDITKNKWCIYSVSDNLKYDYNDSIENIF